MTLTKDQLLKAIRGAVLHNPEVQVAPSCILWPDGDRLWEAITPLLRQDMPELFTLGPYNADEATGPAIWLRCVVGRTLKGVPVPDDTVPVLYLPGVSRADLRAVEGCPDHLKPIAPLQYSGAVWSQVNSKDWTILAFLKSRVGGLGLDVAQDAGTREALDRALSLLLKEDVASLRGKRLDKAYFNGLIEGDPDRDILKWLDQGDVFRQARTDAEWEAFVEVCTDRFDFNPASNGVLVGASMLAAHQGPWQKAWSRFCEAPHLYPHVPEQIRRTNPPSDMFADVSGWPQCNEEQESALRSELLSLANLPPHKARVRVVELAKTHAGRFDWVWAKLGRARLANAIVHLSVLAEHTAHPLVGETTEAYAHGYRLSSWKADSAVIEALACAQEQKDSEAIGAAARALYLQWAEEAALHLQQLVETQGYPVSSRDYPTQTKSHGGECYVFVDGLRLDTARRLKSLLESEGCDVTEVDSWAALPTITATGKPAVSPVHDNIAGQLGTLDFEPCVSETGQSLKGGYHQRRLLEEDRWQILSKSETGDPSGRAWTEVGNIDQEGHANGWKLATRLDGLLSEISERITGLLAAGWRNIRVVTDHGWLLLPGGLPKSELPAVLTETKWARCALVKEGSASGERLYSWYWNRDQSVALAPGISCYRAGEEFAHGGLSAQECLTLELQVTLGTGPSTEAVKITHVRWKGLRCTVDVDGAARGSQLDIRTQPGNATSTLVENIRPVREDGTVSVAVPDDALEGTQATIVVLSPEGTLIAQQVTTIGGGDS